jgi:hypothetical protein
VFGNCNTAIRGGAGIIYDRFNDDQILQLRELPPLTLTSTATYTTIADLLATPLRNSPSGVFAIERSYHPPTVYNWSLGIQQNLGWGTVLDTAYVGSVGRYLLQRRSFNSVPYGARFRAGSIDPSTGNTPLPDNYVELPFSANPGEQEILQGPPVRHLVDLVEVPEPGQRKQRCRESIPELPDAELRQGQLRSHP